MNKVKEKTEKKVDQKKVEVKKLIKVLIQKKRKLKKTS